MNFHCHLQWCTLYPLQGFIGGRGTRIPLELSNQFYSKKFYFTSGFPGGKLEPPDPLYSLTPITEGCMPFPCMQAPLGGTKNSQVQAVNQPCSDNQCALMRSQWQLSIASMHGWSESWWVHRVFDLAKVSWIVKLPVQWICLVNYYEKPLSLKPSLSARNQAIWNLMCSSYLTLPIEPSL